MSLVWMRQPMPESTRQAFKKVAKKKGFSTARAYLRFLIHKAIRESE